MKFITHPEGSLEKCFTVEDRTGLLGQEVIIKAFQGSGILVFEDELTGLINALIMMRDVILPLNKVLAV